MRILHLEDDPRDALMIRQFLQNQGMQIEWVRVAEKAEFESALQSERIDAVVCDNGVPGLSSRSAIKALSEKHPHVPFMIVSASVQDAEANYLLRLGARHIIRKDQLRDLAIVLRSMNGAREAGLPVSDNVAVPSSTNDQTLRRLVTVVQELSKARTMTAVVDLVRHAARELTGADGATFILRDGDQCFYVDEDAIAPLWKGQKFPMSACVSGWAMLNRCPVEIPDIFQDSRVPIDAYRPTFVKSMVMVPIRPDSPIGAIGNYWSTPHQATRDELELLQALANTTSVALENVQLYTELENRVQDRTVQLQDQNRELEAFSSSVSHDLRGPLAQISGFAQLLEEACSSGSLGDSESYIKNILRATKTMSYRIDDLLRLSRFNKVQVRSEIVDLSAMVKEILATLQSRKVQGKSEIQVAPNLRVIGDAGLLKVALENLLSNAWKYSSRQQVRKIEFGAKNRLGHAQTFFVRDNGVGFDMASADALFTPFCRLHSETDFEGHGVGLATAQRVIHRHGGKIWAESESGKGATFFFTLNEQPNSFVRQAESLHLGKNGAAQARKP